ncbi:MAG: hypothetical protein EZS28_049035, partial [Streblomastix strix]
HIHTLPGYKQAVDAAHQAAQNAGMNGSNSQTSIVNPAAIIFPQGSPKFNLAIPLKMPRLKSQRKDIVLPPSRYGETLLVEDECVEYYCYI